jgi:hypothetical protein
VPFSAAGRSLHHGVLQSEMRYYRDANGSFRIDASATGAPTLITINDRVRRVIILRGESGEWSEAPMPSNMARRGPLQEARMPGLASVGETRDGLLLHKYSVRDGGVELLAPELNFFPVRKEKDGVVEEYFDVRIGNQPAELFAPPTGAPVRVVGAIKELNRR